MKNIKKNKSYRLLVMSLLFLCMAYTSLAQTTITGTVTDENGSPLPGANITVKENSSLGATTDFDGNYEIVVTNENTLVFSFVSYLTKAIKINNRSVVNIKMIVDSQNLDEVILIGYGSVKKSDLTGSVASVSSEDLTRTVNQSFVDALDGRVAGVQLNGSEGSPGGDLSIRIRGGTSISASNDPLYVIDGFPIVVEREIGGAEGFATTSSNALAGIDPNDIESIQILKDASATAIYGSRGANGVVIITTKTGKEGKSVISFDTFTSLKELPNQLGVLNEEQYAQYRKTQWEHDPDSFIYKYFEDPASFAGTGTNWQDAIYRTAQLQSYRLSIAGGTKDIKYNISLGAFLDEGIIEGSSFNRYNARVNLNGNISEKMRFSVAMTGAFTNQEGVPTGGANNERAGAVFQALTFPPVIPIDDTDDTSEFSGVQSFNPLSIINNSFVETKGDVFFSNFSLDYDITSDLTFKVLLGGTSRNSKRSSYFTTGTGPGAIVGGRAGIRTSSFRSWVNENTLTYTKKIDKHSLSVLVGGTIQEGTTEQFNAESFGFAVEDLGFASIGIGTNPQAPFSNIEKWSLASGLSRVNYNFDQRFLLTASFRADGSSRFAEGNKWGYFPAVAAAWRISNERFLENSNFIKNLKVRAGYGVTGNQEVARYQSLSSLAIDFYSFGTDNGSANVGTAVNRVSNPDLSWELTEQLNFGVDFGLFDNKLVGTVDYYIKNTTDMLLAINLIPSSGISSPALQNIGSMRNSGLEISLNSVNILTEDFDWKTSFNISFNKNEITDLGPYSEIFIDIPGGNHNIVNEVVLRPGEAIGTFFGYETAGIYGLPDNPTPEEVALSGTRIFVDQDGNGVINDDDRVIIGNALPIHYGGFTNDFRYKNFDLSIFFNWSYGADKYNANRTYTEGFLNSGGNKSSVILNAWTPDNQDTDIAAINKSNDQRFMDRYIEDASFLRLKNISVGYTFDNKTLDKTFLSYAKIYVAGQNLWTLTNYTGYNPDADISRNPVAPGVDWGAYPIAQIYTLGINVKF
ncbi:MAG: TonB-dependent receptor [Flavobacteriaceae bacterium]|nr:TonB-dependent receptor [Flavobacteriaceae bacterium]